MTKNRKAESVELWMLYGHTWRQEELQGQEIELDTRYVNEGDGGKRSC